jgi:hypothetical protein
MDRADGFRAGTGVEVVEDVSGLGGMVPPEGGAGALEPGAVPQVELGDGGVVGRIGSWLRGWQSLLVTHEVEPERPTQLVLFFRVAGLIDDPPNGRLPAQRMK